MSTISNTTLQFLTDLKKNNEREWFQANKKRYEASNEELIAFADTVLQKMNEVDKIETPNGKKSLFRIYRDVRFSKNKDPYKINRSGTFSREGVDRRGGYYFSVEPGNTIIGGGFFGPNKEDLYLLRKQIELDADPLRKVLQSKKFSDYFGELKGEKLKTVPRGFDKEDPNLDLLKHKGFYVMHNFSDKEVLAADFADQVAAGLQRLLPFFDVMTMYLTTDLNGESLI